MNVSIGEKKTWDDWKLDLLSMTILMPEAKTRQEDVPGADGLLDLTEALGTVRYGNRELELVFDVSAYPERWHIVTSEIAGYLHGQRLRVILDTDPDFFYIGRLALDSQKSDYFMNQITIRGDMEPYKYELFSGTEDWEWDPFNFHTGIIRNYRDLEVNGSRRITIIGRKKEIVPTIIASDAMEVEWKGIRYAVPKGESKVYAVSIPEGENYLTFYGNGIISIDYRGGIL